MRMLGRRRDHGDEKSSLKEGNHNWASASQLTHTRTWRSSTLNQGLRGNESIFTRRRILISTHTDSGFLLMHMMASGRYRGRGLRFSVFQGIK